MWTRLAPGPLAHPIGLLAVGPLYSERGSPGRLDPKLEPSLPRLARATASIEVTGAPLKTATDRAVEAIEAAEKIFADEMGGTLGLSPAAKIALVATITAAIQAAIAEERQHLTWVL